MRITFQPSSGRGEYEISENASNGIRPVDLLDHFMSLRLNGLSIDTRIKLTNDQGKYRLRVDPSTRYPQAQNQLACAILLPKPIREERKTEGGQPVVQANAYIIKHINLDNVTITSATTFTADVTTVDCQNKTVQAEQVLVAQRMREIQRIWQQRGKLPDNIATLLAQHERIIRSGSPIPRTSERLVRDLQEALERYSEDAGVPYTSGTYVVPALLAMIDEVVEEVPLSLEQIDPGQTKLRRREIKKWQIYANRRGADSVKFRKNVQAAYDYQCIMCGCRYPSTLYNRNPGIDAAHIIPWSLVDLDEVYNGVALCKLHHWAFDERLLRITYRIDTYYVEISDEAMINLVPSEFSLDQLQKVVGPIQVDRLPRKRSDWPRPDLLERLQHDIAEELE